MASSPRWKVYDSQGEYQACTKRLEEAAVLVAFLGAGSTIRQGHKHILWTEGKDGEAGESYDGCAEHCLNEVEKVAQAQEQKRQEFAKWYDEQGKKMREGL